MSLRLRMKIEVCNTYKESKNLIYLIKELKLNKLND